MKASAPGKLVLSGAYAVLFGAPAIVTAVDRRVIADDSRQTEFEAPEVLAGIPLLPGQDHAPRLPHFDASALRKDERKLGLGSSAGICVSSLALLLRADLMKAGQPAKADDLRHALFEICLAAHRLAQGGGSGIDVAAACFGKTLIFTRPGNTLHKVAPEPPSSPELPSLAEVHLPGELVFEIWASRTAASTADFVRAVKSSHSAGEKTIRTALENQSRASHQAAEAAKTGNADGFILALRRQQESLSLLGKGAEIPIVTPEVGALHATLAEQAAFLPSGAGGGDVSLYVGRTPTTPAFRAAANQAGLEAVSLNLDAEGLRFES